MKENRLPTTTTSPVRLSQFRNMEERRTEGVAARDSEFIVVDSS